MIRRDFFYVPADKTSYVLRPRFPSLPVAFHQFQYAFHVQSDNVATDSCIDRRPSSTSSETSTGTQGSRDGNMEENTKPDASLASDGLDLLQIAAEFSINKASVKSPITKSISPLNDIGVLERILYTHPADKERQAPEVYEQCQFVEMINSSLLDGPMAEKHDERRFSNEALSQLTRLSKKKEQQLGAEMINMVTLNELAEQMIMKHIERRRFTEMAIQNLFLPDNKGKTEAIDKLYDREACSSGKGSSDSLSQKVVQLVNKHGRQQHTKGKAIQMTSLFNEKERVNHIREVDINPQMLNDQVEQMIRKHVRRRHSMELVALSDVKANRKRASESDLQRYKSFTLGAEINPLFHYDPMKKFVQRDLRRRSHFSL